METLVKKIKGYLPLFLTMLKIGLFTFGGGYAMIALFENEFVEKKKWLEKDEFLDVAAIAESTPGPIAINAATYIGYKNAGIIGSIIATLGICIPSFIIIYAISLFFDAFLSLTLVAYAFKGIQICVVYLILTAGLKMLAHMKKNAFNIIIISITLICMVVFSMFAVKFSTIFYIMISGACGVVVYLLGKIRKEEKQ
ncbi:MAG: chromate transporter [Oscillospiraceae bacterium]|nr:chromate transporter [Oscillospiraceae bacterium]